MRVSVVLPNYNGSKYLSRAIDSFLAQDYKEKELIIVDAKSTDGSHRIIDEYVGKHPAKIRWIQEKDSGISDAVNIGIRHSSGDIIGFLGSDDVLLESALGLVGQYCSLVDCDGVYFNKYLYFVQEREFILRKPPAPKITTAALLEHGTITDLQTMFYRRRVYQKYQLNPQNKTCMDYELLFELARDDAFLAHVDTEVVLEYMDGNISHGDPRQLREAQEVAGKFMGDYDGPLWSDHLTGRKARREQAFHDQIAALEHELRVAIARAETLVAERDQIAENAARVERQASSTRKQLLDDLQLQQENALLERSRFQAETQRFEGEVQRLQRQIDALYASTSWRVTKPLRMVMKLFRH